MSDFLAEDFDLRGFLDELLKFKKRKQLSAAALGRMLDLSPDTIERLCAAPAKWRYTPLSLRTATRICKTCDISIDKFVIHVDDYSDLRPNLPEV